MSLEVKLMPLSLINIRGGPCLITIISRYAWASTEVPFVGNPTASTYLVNMSPITNIYFSPDKDVASRTRQSAATTSQGEDTGIGNSRPKVLTVIG